MPRAHVVHWNRGEIRARPGGKRACHEIESQPIECVALSQGEWPLSGSPLSMAVPCAERRPVDLCQSKHRPVSNRAAPPATPGRRIFYKASLNSSSEIQLTTVDFLSFTGFLAFSYDPDPKLSDGGCWIMTHHGDRQLPHTDCLDRTKENHWVAKSEIHQQIPSPMATQETLRQTHPTDGDPTT